MSKFNKIVTQDGFVSERIDVHKNRLLGNYDNTGNYIIDDKIKEELLRMEKKKQTTYDNSLFCLSNNLGIGELTFQISYDKKIVGGKVGSKLYLLEDVYKVNGYYINTIKTEIASFEDVVANYMERSYSFYNVILDDDESEKDIEDLDFSEIPFPYTLAKMSYEQALFKNMEEAIYKDYEEYFETKLDTLNKMGNNFSKAVLSNYEQELTVAKDRFLMAGNDNNKKSYDEILNKSIEIRVDVKASEKENLEEYKHAIYEPTIKLAEDYNNDLELGKKKARKQMSKKDYSFVVEIENDLAEHNSKIDKTPAWDCGFVDEVEVKQNKVSAKEEKNIEKAVLLKDIKSKLATLKDKNLEDNTLEEDSVVQEEKPESVEEITENETPIEDKENITEQIDNEFADIMLEDTENKKEEKKKKKAELEKKKKEESLAKNIVEEQKNNQRNEKILDDELSM